MMNRELALAFDFKSAPAEVQKAAEAYRASWTRFAKASEQLDAWQKELDDSSRVNSEAGKVFRRAMDNWEAAQSAAKTKLEEKKP